MYNNGKTSDKRINAKIHCEIGIKLKKIQTLFC